LWQFFGTVTEVGIKKIKATEVTCDACGASQVVTDTLEIIGFSGLVSEQGPWGGTGGVKFFACTSACLQKAIGVAIERSYGHDDGT
jgi:hypothetical protein